MAQRTTDAPVGERRLAMTYEQFLAWAGDSAQAEWVVGEAIAFMPPTIRHGYLIRFLVTLLGNYVDLFDLGALLTAPIAMRLARLAREPDILFVARENLYRLTPEQLEGPADLVIEVVSDDSVTRDRVEKRAEYAAAGIPEYWVFDPRPGQHRADFFRLGVGGVYAAVPLGADGRYRSLALPGFWLDPAWLWQEPLPKPLTLLADIAPGAAGVAGTGAAPD